MEFVFRLCSSCMNRNLKQLTSPDSFQATDFKYKHCPGLVGANRQYSYDYNAMHLRQ
jgi:hypothetical protein